MIKPNKLYHCTTPKKAKLYRKTGFIKTPVRGFDCYEAALAWCVKTQRTEILELNGWEQDNIHKLPDHHNQFGTAYWVDENVVSWKGFYSANKS